MTAVASVTDQDVVVRFRAPWTIEDHALFVRTKALPECQVEYQAPEGGCGTHEEWVARCRESEAYLVRAPARFAHLLGLEAALSRRGRLPAAGHLWAVQAWIVDLALEAKRYAIWSDCGTGKTPMQLEWARQVVHMTGGRVLIMAPPEVCRQTIEEAAKFYPGGDVAPVLLASRDAVAEWCRGTGPGVAITNYEKLIPGVMPELRWLAGLVLDESSILKGGGGVIKWNLIKSARGIEFKLSCTATPAPNDTMEYASQASFLEKLRTEGEILWTFFHRDPRTQQWKVKPHAAEAFYRFMSGWSIYLRKPGAYGFDDPFAGVPEPEIVEMRVSPTPDQERRALVYLRSYDPDSLLPQQRLGVMQRTKLSQLAKGFLYGKKGAAPERVESRKPAVVADLVRAALKDGRQVLVWTVFDEESDILMEHLAGENVQALHGRDDEESRVEKLLKFRHGEVPALISKAQLLGYGMNFQFCTRMIFSGFDDSFERFYQAVRRCHRYGSKEQLVVYVPFVPGLEDHVWDNILRKRSQWESDVTEQERRYAQAVRGIQEASHGR